jgi:hypothetical protein
MQLASALARHEAESLELDMCHVDKYMRVLAASPASCVLLCPKVTRPRCLNCLSMQGTASIHN